MAVVLCGMPTIQYSAQIARLSVHRLFTYCIRRGLVSRDSLVDGDWLPATEWCHRYLPCCQRKKSGRLLVRGVQAGDDFELIPMVEMETTNPVEGYFDNEFRRSCNHCGVMVAWSRKTLNIFRKFCVFSKNAKLSKKCLTPKRAVKWIQYSAEA